MRSLLPVSRASTPALPSCTSSPSPPMLLSQVLTKLFMTRDEVIFWPDTSPSRPLRPAPGSPGLSPFWPMTSHIHHEISIPASTHLILFIPHSPPNPVIIATATLASTLYSTHPALVRISPVAAAVSSVTCLKGVLVLKTVRTSTSGGPSVAAPSSLRCSLAQQRSRA